MPTIYLHDYSHTLAERAASRHYTGPYQWQPANRTLANGRNRPFDGRAFYMGNDGQMATHGAGFRLRVVHDGRANRWSGIDGEEGWGAIALRLPHGRGYLAGASLGDGMLATCDAEVYAEEEEALYAGREIARLAAEADAEDQAELDAEEED